MALEIELKMRVDDLGGVRRMLEQNGATPTGRRLETNTFLDTVRDDLLKQGAGLRVRRCRDLASGRVTAAMTHKGPKQPGAMKIREETEFGVEDYDAAVCLLGQLGYLVKLSFEKKREMWDMGDCEVVLDELPEGLGYFVEIEGPGEEAIGKVREKLGLGKAVVEPSGYAVLVAKYLKPAGRTVMTFGD